MRKILIFALMISLASAGGFSLKKIWDTGGIFKVPESVLYDGNSGYIYVSNINGSPTAKDGNGFISKLTKDGKIVSLRWAEGLDAPKGMAIFHGKLYVSDITKLVEIDLSTGKLLRKYPAPGARFLNDVAVDDQGVVYVSDSSDSNSVIYRLKDGKLQVWIKHPELRSPNGIFYRKGKLYAGSFADGRIFSCDTESGEVKQVARAPMPIDGLILTDSLFIISDWQGSVGILEGGKFYRLLHFPSRRVNAADIGFIPGENVVLVPTFFANSVVAYKLEK